MVVKNGDESHGIKKKSPESKSKRIRANLYFRFYLNTLNMDSMKVSNNLLPFIKNGHSFPLLQGLGRPNLYIPGTRMTPFFIGKNLVLEGWNLKIEEKQAPGTMSILGNGAHMIHMPSWSSSTPIRHHVPRCLKAMKNTTILATECSACVMRMGPVLRAMLNATATAQPDAPVHPIRILRPAEVMGHPRPEK